MDSWHIVGHEDLDEQSTIYLMERDDEFVIQVDGRELMGSGPHASEDALADLTCDRMTGLDSARILVGGLGMGFTAAAALRRIGATGCVTVAELVGAVVRWNRHLIGDLASHPLRDRRCVIYPGDVGELIETPPTLWSAILLDVDNGPQALTTHTNQWLYTRHGLEAARDALVPGGMLAVWSAHDHPPFTRRLRKAGFEVEHLWITEDGRPTPDDSGSQLVWMARSLG